MESYQNLSKEQLLALAEPLLKTNYGKYLVEVAYVTWKAEPKPA